MKRNTTAIILAAGSGLRMGLEENKVYLKLSGKNIVSFSIDAFANHPQIKDIILVTRADEAEKGAALLSHTKIPSRVVIGGASRQKSVYNALVGLDSKYVLVHDGARPLVQAEDITNCIKALKHYDGAVLAYPLTQQIYTWKQGKIAHPLTETLWAAQTPQGFHTKVLQACHQKHKNTAIATDDSSLLELENYLVTVVKGNPSHCKVTLPMDLQAVQKQLENAVTL